MQSIWMRRPSPNVADERLNSTKVRLHNLRGSQSLFRITIRAIMTDIIERGVIDLPIEILPTTVQQECLDYFLSLKCRMFDNLTEFRRRKAIFERLLRILKIKSIHLDGLMTFCPQLGRNTELSAVLKLIVTHAPDLERLTISEYFYNVRSFNYVAHADVSRGIMETICNLTKLKKLTISTFNVNFSDLQCLCLNLQDLFYVNVILHFDLKKPHVVTDTSAFKNLKFFLFSPMSTYYEGNICKRLNYSCLDQLPKLKIVRAHVGSSFVKPADLIQFKDHPKLNDRAFELRHLLINDPESCPSPNMIPHVTHLEIMWPANVTIADGKIYATPRFSLLRSLSLKNIPSAEILDQFLNNYGSQLIKLRVSKPPDCSVLKYEFAKIFNSCPKLEELRLNGIDGLDRSVPSNFSRLKYLYWASQESAKNRFANMLHAPELQELYLGEEFFDKDDINRVAFLIENRQILGKLERMIIVSSAFPIEHREFYTRMRHLLLNASAFLPNLNDVDIHFSGGLSRNILLRTFELGDLLNLYHGRV